MSNEKTATINKNSLPEGVQCHDPDNKGQLLRFKPKSTWCTNCLKCICERLREISAGKRNETGTFTLRDINDSKCIKCAHSNLCASSMNFT